jgi:hypothetical protein
VVDDVGSPLDGLALRPKLALRTNPFRHRAGIPTAQLVELEPARMRHRYALAVAEDVPEWAIRQLFEPALVDWCIKEGEVFFELENQVLVVAFRGIVYAPNELDDILARAEWLLDRIADAGGSGPVVCNPIARILITSHGRFP